MIRLRLGPACSRRLGEAGWALAALALLFTGAGATSASVSDQVVARSGPVTVSATDLRPGPSGTLVADVHISTSGQPSDELDAAIAAGSTAVSVYHERVNVGEIPDLTGCGAESAPPGVVDHWLHYGALLVPGRSGGSVPPASATLTVQQVTRTARQTLAITLYFAHAGALTMKLPVDLT